MMAIITDEDYPYWDEYLLYLGEKALLRRAEYIIENPLYRYRQTLKWSLEEIRTGRIYISDMSEQNDPFDSSYAISDEELKKEMYEARRLLKYVEYYFDYMEFPDGMLEDLYGNGLDAEISIEDFIKRVSSVVGISENRIFTGIKRFLGGIQRRHCTGYKIACFSERNNSIPMWAYYAHNHEGICLEYDIRKLPPESELRKAFCKVHYSEHRPRDLYGAYSLVVKSSQWSHEQEWRLICKSRENYIEVPCLSAVYLGLRFNFEKADDIISAIKDSGKDVKLFCCEADQERYDLQFRQILI